MSLCIFVRIAANDSEGVGGYASPERAALPCHNTTMTFKLTAAAVVMILL